MKNQIKIKIFQENMKIATTTKIWKLYLAVKMFYFYKIENPFPIGI